METNKTTTMLSKICEQSLCTFAENGICMDGKGENCSFLKNISDSEITIRQDTEEAFPTTKKSDIIKIASGDDLTAETFEKLTYEVPTKLILLIGEPDCGKSTLFASIFDRFQKGNFGQYSFAGTETPIGFERRAHHARIVSQNLSSKAERTTTGEFTYLHLKLKRRDDSVTSHILFADISGEKYKDARASDSIMQSINIFRYSSHIFLIANGELLLNGGRHDLRTSLIHFMNRALKNNVLVPNQLVHLLITKWDKVLAANKAAEAQIYLVDHLKNKYPTIISNKTFLIASRSVNADYPAGSGLDIFLDQCVSTSETTSVTIWETEGKGNRIFQNFQLNINGKSGY